MSHARRLRLAILIAFLVTGCGIQDSTQPPENSISAGPKSDGSLVKTKKPIAVGKTKSQP